MDHATRHLSSPSPTSSFLFHHADKSYKGSSSELLGPFLSSETEDSDVNPCFSANTNNSVAIQSFSSHQSDEDSEPHFLQRENSSLNHAVTTEQNKSDSGDGTSLILGDFGADEGTRNDQVHVNLGSNTNEGANMDDEDDEEEDENMRNMLSSSSRSSATTMPLLTDAHAHHSFSERISLGEYSPLSLVNDCDNALPMSPTSLACGSQHSSFKSSLNNLKIDHLGVDGVVDVGVHGVDDVVGDTRSMSPSLLSNTNHNHNNMWSNSSTAITQNPSLLTSTSTSILLSQHSHHHPSQHSHHQSLMQQLEPQSLDEAPPLIGDSSSTLDSDLNHSQANQVAIHRPSSEPPLTGEVSPLKNFDSFNATTSSSVTKSVALTSSTGRNRKQSSSCSVNLFSVAEAPQSVAASSYSIASRPSSTRSRSARSRTRSSKVDLTSNADILIETQPHSSKLHLQLNHHKKLKELQQRLFGTTTDSNNDATQDASKDGTNSMTSDSINPTANTVENGIGSREEADSSANQCQIDNSRLDKSTNQTAKRKRPSRAQANSKSVPDTLSQEITSDSRSTQRSVKTETAEPDTTTKSSDCLKLADLLSPNTNVEFARANGNLGFVLNAESINRFNSCDNNSEGERKVQHIQLQMNPSLKVVSNTNGLVQPMNIQHQLQLSSNEGAIITGTSNQLARHLQPLTAVLADTDGGTGSLSSLHFKCNNDTNIEVNDIKKGNNNESSEANNQCNINKSSATNTIGAHQIAIQVICQDGTSLVLPVSSATSLNTAVALSSQNQAQLQAILSSNGNNPVFVSNCHQHQRSNGTQHILPVVTMINAQPTNILKSIGGNTESSSSYNSSGSTSSSGLAASAPTLAALLDGGSSRTVNFGSSLDLQQGSQNILSGNILRKFVTNGPAVQNYQAISSDSDNTAGNETSESDLGRKRIKLESGLEPNAQNSIRATTFTILDAQGLIVTNGNEFSCGNDSGNNNISNNNNNKNIVDTNILESGDGRGIVTKQGSGNAGANQQKQSTQTSYAGSDNKNESGKNKTNLESTNSSTGNTKTSKMTSSTGNRQVDPAQPFRCEHCNSTFTRLGNFTRHKKIHTVPTKDGQRFKCDVCSKSFLQRCDLARHLHIHRGTEPHRCNICGKGYIRHSDLVTHQRFHNKEKPFGCPHCSKGFCQRGDLNRHLRSIHLQMKPILCPCCNRKFAKQETLLRHLNTAHRGNNKPATIASTSSQAIIAEISSSPQIPTQINTKDQDSPGDETKADSVARGESSIDLGNVNNDASINSNTTANNQKVQAAVPVASLQAIQATLCKVQSSDSSRKIKVLVSTAEGSANIAKASS